MRLRRPLLLALAGLCGAWMTLYSAVWMYGARRTDQAFLGVEFGMDAPNASLLVQRVKAGSPAERAGLQAGDRIVAVNGEPLATPRPFSEAVAHGRPGDAVRLGITRRGAPRPSVIEVRLGERPEATAERASLGRRVIGEILAAYPVLFLFVGVAVLFLRVEDAHAWRLALLFAGFIAGAPYFEHVVPEGLRGITIAFKSLFFGIMPAVFYAFFASFPEPSPLDRRLPWLKTLWLALAVTVAAPLAAWAGVAGSYWPLWVFAVELPRGALWAARAFSVAALALGLASLAANAVLGSPVARRKTRVILWGVLLGYGPLFLMFIAGIASEREYLDFPFWVWAPSVMALFLIPLSFAYAVVKHRVLEVPVLLRRSARYLLVQRGALGVLVLLGVGAALSFAYAAGHHLKEHGPAAGLASVALGTAFGSLLIVTGTRAHRRLSERIDRAFFRKAYDARHVLQDLAERARTATSREELAALIEHHVGGALLPRAMGVFLQADRLRPHPVLDALLERGGPADVEPEARRSGRLPGPVAEVEPECLVPILGRDASLSGLLALGARRSEEPYSREDKRLLASVAAQAGIALDTMRLAEQMAERLEADRRAAHEMELAQRVQRRLMPQEHPSLATLEYEGLCLQARAVGGDYYDFLELGPGRLGLVLADVSGKGFAAALLMAALQASLRSRAPEDMLDLPRQLRAVNGLLYRSSDISRFATLFIGLYEESSRRLLYANCGHNPPVLLRAGGAVERLPPTAAVLGLLEEWDCATAEVALAPGDMLVVFTDGVVEAWSDAGEEFGEERLLATLRGCRRAPVAGVIEAVVEAVRRFSGSEQEDDLTLVIARGR